MLRMERGFKSTLCPVLPISRLNKTLSSCRPTGGYRDIGTDGAVALVVCGSDADGVCLPTVEALDEAVSVGRSAGVLRSVTVFGRGVVVYCPSARCPVHPGGVQAAAHDHRHVDGGAGDYKHNDERGSMRKRKIVTISHRCVSLPRKK